MSTMSAVIRTSNAGFEPIPILASDERLVAVNKPPGVAVVPAPGAPARECVRGMVERQLGIRLWVVHRLDRDASGVLLFARTADAHREMSLAFESRAVRKTYVALTSGVPSPREGRVTAALHAARRGRTRPALPGEAGSREAATGYRVRRVWSDEIGRVALVEAHPETGRHHQIRVHLRSIGTPILFDEIYGRAIEIASLDKAPCQRLALHAVRLVVPGPEGTPRAFEAPLAPDLASMLNWLDGEWTPDA